MRVLFALLAAFAAAAQELPPRVEITANAWRTAVSGKFQSGIVPVDLRSDLALRNNWQFQGSALIRIAGRHRLVLDGSPLSFSGRNLLNRTVTYGGRTYNVRETVRSDADMTMAFAGYQYDVVSRPGGHFGFRIGGQYVDASGILVSTSTGIEAASSYQLGIPLAGFEGRVRLLPRWLDAGGEVQGMGFGGYGHFMQGAVNFGVPLGAVGLRAGYRWLDADLHENTSTPSRIGVAVRLTGPVVGIAFRLP